MNKGLCAAGGNLAVLTFTVNCAKPESPWAKLTSLRATEFSAADVRAERLHKHVHMSLE
jgi:hypothetical protein